MHPTACIIVTQFCNPDMFSNTHGLFECFLQCKSKKEKTLQCVKAKLTRFVSDSISSAVSPMPLTKKRGETVFTKLITTEANPITGEAADLRLEFLDSSSSWGRALPHGHVHDVGIGTPTSQGALQNVPQNTKRKTRAAIKQFPLTVI